MSIVWVRVGGIVVPSEPITKEQFADFAENAKLSNDWKKGPEGKYVLNASLYEQDQFAKSIRARFLTEQEYDKVRISGLVKLHDYWYWMHDQQPITTTAKARSSTSDYTIAILLRKL